MMYSTISYSTQGKGLKMPRFITKYKRCGSLSKQRDSTATTSCLRRCDWLEQLSQVGLHTRKVLPQWPQTTLIPSGWMGRAGWAGCSSGITITGLRLIMRLLPEEQKEGRACNYDRWKARFYCWDGMMRQPYCLPVWSRTSYPPGRVFADKQAVTRTPHIFLPCRGVLDGLQGNIEAQFNTWHSATTK